LSIIIQEVEVFIEDGEVRIETRGVKDDSGLETIEELEKALGGQVIEREMMPGACATVQEQIPDYQKLRDE
jgi:hypothetical protein